MLCKASLRLALLCLALHVTVGGIIRSSKSLLRERRNVAPSFDTWAGGGGGNWQHLNDDVDDIYDMDYTDMRKISDTSDDNWHDTEQGDVLEIEGNNGWEKSDDNWWETSDDTWWDSSVSECSGTWTSFYDRDDPSGMGDWEDLQSLRTEHPGAICNNPLAVYAETLHGVSASETGDYFESYDTEGGFICRNTDQGDGYCHDYKVKFCCGAASCSPLTTPTNGNMVCFNGNTYNSVCTFSCNTGYEGSGTALRTCQANEMWSGSVFTCTPVLCTYLTTPSNGNMDCSNGVTYNSVCTFSCDPGYEGSGTASRTCQANEMWSGSDFTCTAVSCPSLTTPTNGNKYCSNGVTYNSVCSFSCNTGYEGSGTALRTCQANEMWSGSVFTCTDIATTNSSRTVLPPYIQGSTGWVTWGEWSACDVTCGGGSQIRSRTCYSSDETKTCVGNPTQSRTCGGSNCPDCSQTCPFGHLDPLCLFCICDGETLEGIVQDVYGKPLESAIIYRAEYPLHVIGQSNAIGQFMLEGVCVNDYNLIVEKEKFVGKEVTFLTSRKTQELDLLKIELIRQESPVITKHPQSKVRREGESVTLCCEAHGVPPPSYYEWFKDGDILNFEQYFENSMTLTNLELSDGGQYKCRANNDAGAQYSEPATLFINADEVTCRSTPLAYMMKLPEGCSSAGIGGYYSVGRCSEESCPGILGNTIQCTDEEEYCCMATSTELHSVECDLFSISVQVVTGCGCTQCGRQTIKCGEERQV